MNTNNTNETNFNDYFRALKEYCNNTSNQSFVLSRKYLNINKQDLIIFEADMKKVDFSILYNQEEQLLKLPTSKLFIEIPNLVTGNDIITFKNMGGILITEEILEHRTIINCSSFWIVNFKGKEMLKPISMSFIDGVYYKKDLLPELNRVGSCWKNQQMRDLELLTDELKKTLDTLIGKILYFLIFKIEKKEYTTYKKWHPSGMETKDIVYDREVCTHKRHFWEDSGRFIIPKLGKEEWEKQGYGTHELVFKDGELRRDVPYKIIGNFLVEGSNGISPDNRRIEIAKGKIFRQEEKLGRIIKELYPNQFIKRHDRKAIKPLELDFYIKELNLAFEYDGEQHYDKKLCQEVFGSDFNELQKRDRKKDIMCRDKGIKLIRIKYDEPLGINLIKRKLK